MNNEVVCLAEAMPLIEEILAADGEFRFYPKGKSMLPLIVEERDSVILKRWNPESIKKRALLLYRRDNGQYVLHRMMKREANGTFSMCGDNQYVWERGIRSEQIIGYVPVLYRKDRPIKDDAIIYRLYSTVWSWRWIRTPLFFVKRILGRIKRAFKKA